MTISDNPTSGGSCVAGETWTPSSNGANLNVQDLAACANGQPVTIGDGGTIDVQDWPAALGVAATLDGDATIATDMSGFGGLTIDGNTTFASATSVTTSADQSYEGAVTLGGATTISASETSFGSTVDSASAPEALTVVGSADFSATVGGAAALQSLTQTGGGNVTLPADVTTSATQSYSGAVIVPGGTDQLDASSFTFASTLDGESNTNLAQLRVTASGAGSTVTFEQNVGQNDGLGSLGVQASAAATVDAVVYTSGEQQWAAKVQLGGDAEFATGGGDITFDATIDGAHSLTVSGGGADYFYGAIGATTPPTSLEVTEGGGNSFLYGNVTVNGSGTKQFSNDVVLKTDVTFSSSGTLILNGIISGSHRLTMSGGGTLEMVEGYQSADSYSGGTVVTDGSTLDFSAGALGDGPITLNDGTLTWSNGASDLSAQLQIGSGGGTLDSNGYDLSFANSVGGSGPLT